MPFCHVSLLYAIWSASSYTNRSSRKGNKGPNLPRGFFALCETAQGGPSGLAPGNTVASYLAALLWLEGPFAGIQVGFGGSDPKAASKSISVMIL